MVRSLPKHIRDWAALRTRTGRRSLGPSVLQMETEEERETCPVKDAKGIIVCFVVHKIHMIPGLE